jgi:hypothetical protein
VPNAIPQSAILAGVVVLSIGDHHEEQKNIYIHSLCYKFDQLILYSAVQLDRTVL